MELETINGKTICPFELDIIYQIEEYLKAMFIEEQGLHSDIDVDINSPRALTYFINNLFPLFEIDDEGNFIIGKFFCDFTDGIERTLTLEDVQTHINEILAKDNITLSATEYKFRRSGRIFGDPDDCYPDEYDEIYHSDRVSDVPLQDILEANGYYGVSETFKKEFNDFETQEDRRSENVIYDIELV